LVSPSLVINFQAHESEKAVDDAGDTFQGHPGAGSRVFVGNPGGLVNITIQETQFFDLFGGYPLVMTKSLKWKIAMLLRTVNHLFLWAIFHGNVK